VVEVERGGVDDNLRSTEPQCLDDAPMSHRLTTVEQSAVDQRKGAEAESRDATTPRVGSAKHGN